MHSLSLSKIYSAKIFIAWIKYTKSPDNKALSSISLAEIIAGYPIAVIVSKVLYAGCMFGIKEIWRLATGGIWKVAKS